MLELQGKAKDLFEVVRALSTSELHQMPKEANLTAYHWALESLVVEEDLCRTTKTPRWKAGAIYGKD